MLFNCTSSFSKERITDRNGWWIKERSSRNNEGFGKWSGLLERGIQIDRLGSCFQRIIRRRNDVKTFWLFRLAEYPWILKMSLMKRFISHKNPTHTPSFPLLFIALFIIFYYFPLITEILIRKCHAILCIMINSPFAIILVHDPFVIITNKVLYIIFISSGMRKKKEIGR